MLMFSINGKQKIDFALKIDFFLFQFKNLNMT